MMSSSNGQNEFGQCCSHMTIGWLYNGQNDYGGVVATRLRVDSATLKVTVDDVK